MDEARVISSPPHREQEVIPEESKERPVPYASVRGFQQGNETWVGEESVREVVRRHEDGHARRPLRDEERREESCGLPRRIGKDRHAEPRFSYGDRGLEACEGPSRTQRRSISDHLPKARPIPHAQGNSRARSEELMEGP